MCGIHLKTVQKKAFLHDPQRHSHWPLELIKKLNSKNELKFLTFLVLVIFFILNIHTILWPKVFSYLGIPLTYTTIFLRVVAHQPTKLSFLSSSGNDDPNILCELYILDIWDCVSKFLSVN